jgi:hypothetical protein
MVAMHRSQLVGLIGIAFLAGWAIVGLSAGRAAAFEPIAIAPTTSNVSGVPFLNSTPPPDPNSAIGSPSTVATPSSPAAAPRQGVVSPAVAIGVAIAVPLLAVGFVLFRRRTTQP